MVVAFQNTQVLLLATVLLAACLAKLTIREPVPAAPDHVHGVPVPAVLRSGAVLRGSRRASVWLGLAEGVLALALLVSSHVSVRLATTATFAAAAWAVGELRVHRPDAGCGCFGGLSTKRVGRRSVVRAVLFTAAAVAALGAPHTGLDVLWNGTTLVALVLAVELVLFAALSPELSELARRHRLRGGLRHRPPAPCERRRSGLDETLTTLYDSDAWLAYENSIASAAPLDIWREGCWRFLTFLARVDGRDVEVVFAVSTAERDRVVRSALVKPDDAVASVDPVPACDRRRAARRPPLYTHL